MIFETIITTANPAGEPHIAPFGVKYDGDLVLISPYKPSTTLENILASKIAVLNVTDDVRVFAAAICNKKEFIANDIKLTPLEANSHAVCRLANVLSYTKLELIDVKQDDARPTLVMQKSGFVQVTPFIGFNRAQAAVLELCVLASRLHLLPREKIESEMAYLQIAIDKTASEREKTAWDWLQQKIAVFYMQAAES